MKGSEFAIARYYAVQAVKQQWKDRGLRLPPYGELHSEAHEYLDNHPELIEFATERYRYFVESGYLKRPRNRRKPMP